MIMVVMVIVIMSIQRQRPTRSGAKQRPVLRSRSHNSGRSFTADVTVQADHPIRCAHDHVKFVADHQHRAAGFATHRFDLTIKRGRAGLVEPLCCFVQQ